MFKALKRAKNMGVFALPRTKIATLFKHRKKLEEVEKAFFYSRYCNALFLAQKLGIFPVLREGACTLKSLSQKTKIPEGSLKTLTSILIAQGFLDRQNDLYCLSEFGDFFLKEENVFSSNYILELMAEQAFGLSATSSAIYEGGIPEHLDITKVRGAYSALLNAVNNYLLWSGRELLNKVDLGNIHSGIVGTTGVSFSSLLLQKYPKMKITYACLEHLIPEIPHYCRRYGVSQERIEAVHSHIGDPLQDDWGNDRYDLVLITRKMLVDPQQRIGEKFAEKSFLALNPKGKAIFWETVYPDRGKMPLNRAMEAMFDFCTSPAAIARTEKEYRELLHGIGFHKVEIHDCLEGQTSFIIAEK